MDPTQVPGLQRAKGLVKLMGLDLGKVTHKVVWGALAEGRAAETEPLCYKLVQTEGAGSEPVFPARKPKRKRESSVTEDAYVPPGIFKSNWMSKHETKVPAVVVLFFDLEWEAEDWDAQQAHCAATIKGLRESMNERASRLVVVLLQEKHLEDGNELVQKRAVSLREAGELHERSSLFVLPSTSPELKGMVLRLEQAFFELSTQYYQKAIQRLQTQLSTMNQNTEKVMVVRYTIKIAYYSELKGQRPAALASYQQAYALLKDVREQLMLTSTIGVHEVKSVAGLLMGKICQLLFANKQPRDSIRFFCDHISHYGAKKEKDTIIFLHSAWLGDQYHLFAQIFGEAIVRNGLVASQVEHPGYYYLEAAQKNSQRKRLREGLAVDDKLSSLSILANPSVYVGKPEIGVETDLPNNGRPDEMSQKEFEAACHTVLERQRDHSSAIVDIATKAKGYFQTYNVIKTPIKDKKDKKAFRTTPLTRMAAWLDVYVARELHDLGKHTEALAAVDAAIALYRKEQWSGLLSSTLKFSYRCAYLVGNVNLFTVRALELSGGHGNAADGERAQMLANFTDVSGGVKPTPAISSPPLPSPSAWDGAFENLPKEAISIDMNQLSKCIECKVRFRKAEFSVKEEIEMVVAFRSWLPNDLEFNKIHASFDQPSYESQKVLCDGSDADQPRVLKAGTTTVFKLNFSAAETNGHLVTCKDVSIATGSGPSAVLLWANLKDASEGSSNAKADIGGETMAATKWSSLCNQPTAKMTPLPSLVNMSFEHNDPALLGEAYLVQIKCTSEETSEMSDVRIKMVLLEEDKMEKPSACGHFVTDGKPEAERIFELDSLEAGGTTEHKVYLSFSKPCDVVLAVSFEYSTQLSTSDSDATSELRRSKEYKEKIHVIEPFLFSADIETSQFFSSEHVQPGETFLVVAKLLSQAPCSVRVVRCYFDAAADAADAGEAAAVAREGSEALEPKEAGAAAAELPKTSTVNVEPTETSATNFVQLSNAILSKEEELTDCGAFVVGNMEHETPVSLGRVVLEWTRAPDPSGPGEAAGEASSADGVATYKATAVLPHFAIKRAPLLVEVESSAVGRVEELFAVTYCISNQSTHVQEIEFNIEPHDPFIYSGCQHATVRLLPASIGLGGETVPTCLKLNYNLFPLRGGFATLPLLTVTSKRTQTKVPMVKGLPRVYIKAKHGDE